MKVTMFFKSLLPMVVFSVISSTNAFAIDQHADEIYMKREPDGTTLTKSQVVNRIKSNYKGRILSISAQPKGGEDCHVVKVLLVTGEFKTVHVSCVF